MIKKKVLLVENFDDLNLDLDDLATRIDCSIKSLLKYVDKQFNKKSIKLINIEEEKKRNEDGNNLIALDVDDMMEQLRKMDKTIAPNKNPFNFV
jgi:predicted  nucleic acid-binding Zn-ribbon protein